jgi:hypothetical protein
MTNIEIPLGKRTKFYRFFEMLPAFLSYGAIILLVLLALFAPVEGAIFILLIVVAMFVKALGMAYRTIQGYISFKKTSQLDWARRLNNLSHPAQSLKKVLQLDRAIYGINQHITNLERIIEKPNEFPKPDDIYHAVFVFVYKESYDVVQPTIEALINSNYDSKRMYLVLAYEERGGEAAQDVVSKVKKQYTGVFRDILLYRHPDNLPDEVIGKGPNATYAGRKFAEYAKSHKINPANIIVTTLDADNRVDQNYFPYLTYEWIVTPKRQKVSFQPICLFTNNIWDVPAPMRVMAVGNSFWNVISSMRPHLLRNFASHAQGLQALIEMDFWSKRTIVEDGHQYWRSYFFFDGDYSVVPLRVSVGQDAVLSSTYRKSLVAQFVQVRRWAYGASDVAFVANEIKHRNQATQFWPAFTRLVRLLDSHITQAAIAPIIAVGGWIPLLINPESSRELVVHELPMAIGTIQQIAMIGILVTVFTSLAMLPPRPARYTKKRSFLMVIQWLLMPITSICYASSAAYYSQTRLLIGKYFTVFETTDKNVKKD